MAEKAPASHKRNTEPPPSASVPEPKRRFRVARWFTLVILAVIAVTAISLVIARQRRVTVVRIATGQRGGTSLPLGEELAATFNREHKHVRASAVESQGSLYSIDMLERKEVELALVSNNTQKGDRVRLIAPLYPETLQVVVRKAAKIAAPSDLEKKRVGIGPVASGTEAVALQVLEHFGFDKSRVSAANMTPIEAATKLEAGELDAVFILAGLRAPVVERLLRRDDMALLALGAADKVGGPLDGVHIDAPYLVPSVIPERTYGDEPVEPVGTMAVQALLVARADVDDDVVFDLTKSLFSNKLRLAQKEKLLAHLTEKFDPADSPYPQHPGADRYLRRNEPGAIEKNVDLISLALTVAAILWSGVAAWRAAREKSKKSRIEQFFVKLAELTKSVRAAETDEELAELLKVLNETESHALEELAAERLEANEAFRVLQEGLRTLEDDILRVRGDLRSKVA
jgi:uncharacterized protein